MSTDPPDWVKEGKGQAKSDFNREPEPENDEQDQEPPTPEIDVKLTLEMRGPGQGTAVSVPSYVNRAEAEARVAAGEMEGQSDREEWSGDKAKGQQPSARERALDRADRLKLAKEFKDNVKSKDSENEGTER